MRWNMTTVHPVKGMIDRNPEPARSTYLKPEQLPALLTAIAEHPDRTAVDAIKLLLLTGARSGETFSAKWGQIDLKTGVWSKPAGSTKSGKLHMVPLSAEALQLLVDRDEANRKAAGPVNLRFPGPRRPPTDGASRLGEDLRSGRARRSARARSAAQLRVDPGERWTELAGDRRFARPHSAGNDGALRALVR
jgi:integrase